MLCGKEYYEMIYVVNHKKESIMKHVPEIMDWVTIHNINPRYPDRSYQEEVWKVIAVNKTHAQLKSFGNRSPLSQVIVVLMEEYEFSDAKFFTSQSSYVPDLF